MKTFEESAESGVSVAGVFGRLGQCRIQACVLAAVIGLHAGAAAFAGFSPTLELAALDGGSGIQINGVAAGDHSGRSVSTVGDLNGDGIDDFVIGAPDADPNAAFAGAVYVVFGTSAGFPHPLELSTLDGSNGFVIHGEALFDGAGFSVAAAGDFNGDGIDDLVIGAPDASQGASFSGSTYVVFGTDQGFASPFELSAIDGSNGIVITGIAANESSGTSVSGAGDINGDMIDDLVIGAPFANPGGQAGAGVTYVVFGSNTGFPSPLDLATLNGTNGFVIHGIEDGDSSGTSVSGAGDVNNDGIADIVIGAPIAGPVGANPGMAYVVFGSNEPWTTPFELSGLNGDNGFAINGLTTGDQLGTSVSEAGDINGDGIDDLILGAPQADANGEASGAAYVVFGSNQSWPTIFNLSGLDGANGFAMQGANAGDQAGTEVGAAGDIDGGGIGDLLIGAPHADSNGNSSGAAYLVFGSDQAWSSPLNLSGLDGTSGFRLNGAAEEDRAGTSVGYAGDVNGDGAADFLIGAPGDPLGNSAGKSYLVFGMIDPVGDVIFADGFE